MFDGLLDLTLLPPMNLVVSAAHMSKLYSGEMDKVPGVVKVAVQRLEARVCAADGAPVRIDLDGEQPGKLPLNVECMAGRLQVRGRWPDARVPSPKVEAPR